MKSFLQTQALDNTCSVTNDIEPSFAILYIFVVESSIGSNTLTSA